MLRENVLCVILRLCCAEYGALRPCLAESRPGPLFSSEQTWPPQSEETAVQD